MDPINLSLTPISTQPISTHLNYPPLSEQLRTLLREVVKEKYLGAVFTSSLIVPVVSLLIDFHYFLVIAAS